MRENVLTVTQLTRRIKESLEASLPSSITVTGEISNWTKSSSGHTYFSLKDDKALIKCAVWRSTQLKRDFKDGDKVILTGHISLYEPQGTYQIIVRTIEESGQGELFKKFLEIKEKLEKEGLFDSSKKKSLPAYPMSIGIITSPTGSVIKDIENVLKRRAPYVKKYLYSASVQGKGSAESIISGIEYFNKKKIVDLIIIARGGGSLEDLWAFNDENLAYAISGSQIPVISAVGHETDFTIADFSASVRAPTPSAAAEISVKDVKDILIFLETSKREMRSSIKHDSSLLRQRMSQLKQSFYISAMAPINRKRDTVSFLLKDMEDSVNLKMQRAKDFVSGRKLLMERANPANLIEKNRFNLNSLKALISVNANSLLNSVKNSVDVKKHTLEALNPANVMNRGYALVYRESGEVVTDKATVKVNQNLKIALRDGSFRSKVTSIKEE
ncbi:TPA: exodeoxyribonuclease VII large subunit [candidate division WOR-3 bacterium]|jgi:exodeoxyribonuclease VII large subunit|uniref:Exodeoxyribonuclease 7 large subunit n=1 Tax=candidate division WOR-3 bacterium TaxID=2052148 RepID=A0A350H829_UNCW3|nr:exodeoxyribonuclease VII large subunit [candidate division WOR-3 bacterium]